MTKYPKKNLQQEVEHKNYCFIWACFYQKYVHIYWEQWKFLQRVEGVLLLIKNMFGKNCDFIIEIRYMYTKR